MKEIDWSKAPEGATHYHYDCCYPWLRDGERPAYFRNGKWVEYTNPDTGRAHINDEVYSVPRPAAAPAVPAWDGTGLPPVGTVCEVEDEDGNWHECRILAHHMEDAVFIPDPGYPYGAYDGLPAGRFRPLRTPEQIAAEERERAIDDLCAYIVSHYEAPKMSEHYLGLAKALHDAGYRRQEPKE